MKVTKELCEAILQIRPSPAFQTFLKAISQAGLEDMQALIDAPPDRVGRLQGQAARSRELLGTVDQAAAVLEKLAAMPPTQPKGEDANERSTRIGSKASGAF